MEGRYGKWVDTWNTTIDRVRNVIPKEKVCPLIIHPPATQNEIDELEKQLGYPLPATFRHTLLHFSKGVDLFWNMYEEVEDTIPEEFEEIGSGTIRWGIDNHNLKDLETRANEMDVRGNDEKKYLFTMDIIRRYTDPNHLEDFEKSVEDNWKNREVYRSSLHNKLKFMSVDNGDVIAFDLLTNGEPPVVYWDHETESITYLAPTFHDFIDQITQLYCIGNESCQYGPFLTDKGIDAEGETAKEWRKWFQSFISN